ncbi:MAG: GntR family transcriptional regulator [Oscillospiraceae bacterium]|nr:GntR family transcriptional regulator [Oscillospiraceae bacterium]
MKETLYQQVMNGVLKKIESGFWKENDMISTEAELEKEYSVSNITVRRALKELEQTGMIYRVKGKGSFVCDKSQIRQAKKAAIPSNIITVVVPFSQNNYTAGQILQGVAELFNDFKYILNVVDSQFSLEKERELLKQCSRVSRGIIFYPISSQGNVDILCELKASGYPIVLIDKKINNIPLCSVVSDNEKSAYRAVSYLIEQGHTRIGFMHDSNMMLSSVAERCLGYMRALVDHKIPPHNEYVVSNFMEFSKQIDMAAYEDMQKNKVFTTAETRRNFHVGLLKWIKERGITALFCPNVGVATDLIRFAADAGVSIPQDLSLVGFDDDVIAQNLSVPLTTVRQDLSQVGYRAGVILKNFLELNEPLPEHILEIPAELIVRDSVTSPSEANNK